jgi:hypothetical protein
MVSNKAYKTLVKDPTTYFLLPICFACDETKLHKKTGKTSSWPLLFSTTLFNQKLKALELVHCLLSSSSWLSI